MLRLDTKKTRYMSGVVVGVLLVVAAPLQALPSTLTNEVYPRPSLHDPILDQHFSTETPTSESPIPLSILRNMSATTDLRDFIMKYVEDERICSSRTIRQLILGEEENDVSAKIWWSRRCDHRSGNSIKTATNLPESTLNRYRRKVSKRARRQNLTMSEKEQKKLNKLIKNKSIQCNPKKEVVELERDEHTTMLKPSCVVVKRCGGCCDSDLLECRPTVTKQKKFKVLALKMIADRPKMKFDDGPLRVVHVEEHKKCQCQCRERAEHCSPNQIYDEDACRCHCQGNLTRSCPQGKVWDEKRCDCVCSEVSSCTTGRVFDRRTCRCADPQNNDV